MASEPHIGRFAGRVALVVGQGAIARACAVTLAREGARLVVANPDPAEGDQTAAGIVQSGGAAMSRRHDLDDENQWRALIDATLNRFYRLDAFAYAHLASTRGRLEDLTLNDFRRATRPNLQGPWLGLKYAGPAMRIYGHGAAVVVSSAHGLEARAGLGALAVSGAATRLLVRSTAAEFAARDPKVRVNAVLVGVRHLDLDLATADDERGSPSPFDVAHAVTYALSDAARFLTGTDLVIEDAGNRRTGYGR